MLYKYLFWPVFAALFGGPVWSTAQAAGSGAGGSGFYAETRAISEHCDGLRCAPPYGKKILRLRDLRPEIRRILQRIARTQAQIWADTILEGDYAASGFTRLDRVLQLQKSGRPLGYQIRYSEKAWDTAECRYDGVHDSTLAGCRPGRIFEESFVSPDFRDYFYDESTAAVFLPQKPAPGGRAVTGF